MKITFMFGLLGLLFIVACAQTEDSMEAVKDDAMVGDTADKDAMIEKDTGGIMKESVVLAGTVSPYLEFTQQNYLKALDENKVILLYFYADWCPLCKVEQKETFAAFDELNNENVVGFRVNYRDSATDEDEEAIAKQFGITYQHTKVVLKDGKQVLKAPDSWDKRRYLDEIGKVAE